MSKNPKITKLAEKLDAIVYSEVREALDAQGSGWKEKFECIKFDVDMYYQNAVDLHKDAEENGFTINRIEQEGYLRAMTLVKNLMEEQIKN
jgi:hypothetical protein